VLLGSDRAEEKERMKKGRMEENWHGYGYFFEERNDDSAKKHTIPRAKSTLSITS
jgi:hypothetical protein